MRLWRVGAQVGEAACWDEATDSLFWIDIRRPALHRHDRKGRQLARWPLPEPVGAFALLEAGTHALVALASGLAFLDLQTGAVRPLLDPEPDRPGNRLNEGKVSPCGRHFVFGSMDEGEPKGASGALYRLSADGSLLTLARNLVVANGVAWSPDGATLYFSDSRASVIWACDWNADDGTIRRRRVFASPSAEQGRPDGAGMDEEGHYWSAGVSAGCLNRFAPDGRLVETIPLPVQAPTMPAFGPAGSDLLFVTSHRRVPKPTEADGSIVVLQMSRAGIRPPRFHLLAC